jgi:hypothetical protein
LKVGLLEAMARILKPDIMEYFERWPVMGGVLEARKVTMILQHDGM